MFRVSFTRQSPFVSADQWNLGEGKPRNDKKRLTTGHVMKFERNFTKNETGAYGALEFTETSSEIRNPDGTIVFSLPNLEVPTSWSQVASDVIAQKYFRKAGVPARLKKVR